ncbi:ribosomal protection-like ABC-F family protein [Actinomadura hibisca]|uniref:ribosomal protection-like ABC-F family protein n=1 Tax=Actinomadura hibisca TaxID=68565 RepID=UPI00082CC601|nr:ABC-F family ATP-binding cassette domain-containing protein [Actinomadura hibisca]
MRTPPSQLALAGVTRRYGDRLVLDRVSLTVKPGEKVGVIGENGSGKSTLLRLIAGQEQPDNGDVTVQAPGGIGHLAQTLDLPANATVAQAIDLALADLRALEARLHQAEAALAEPADEAALQARLAGYDALLTEFETRGGYTVDVRVDAALHGLGLPALARDREIGTLSGGESSRLMLAATLAGAPELLLLDEPTNDLDDAAVAWLEDHLRRHRGTVVVITHDRAFLDRVITTILEVDHVTRGVRRYGDGYAGYLAAKEAERADQLRRHEEWAAEVARHAGLAETGGRWLASISRKGPAAFSGAGAHRARSSSTGTANRVRNANERLRQLHAAPVAAPPDPLRFTPDALADDRADGGEGPVAELLGVQVGDRLDLPLFRLERGERLLITGPNGAGKSTLLRVLSGELRPDAGRVSLPGRVGLLRQDGMPGRADQTVLAAFAAGRPGPPDDHADELLALGLFEHGDLHRRVGALSIGQRRRLELARLVSRPVDLLLLDEPTNHLSPTLVDELEEALAAFTGTLVLVTHDRLMRHRFTGSHLELRGGRITELACQAS